MPQSAAALGYLVVDQPSSISDGIPEDNLRSLSFPRARAVEAWLEGLLTCQSVQPRDSRDASVGRTARLLFILDNDFGELTTIMYLVLGQAFFHDARILLSPRLYKTNHDALPGRVDMWISEEYLAKTIDTFQPNVVVFASGYLLPVHNLLSADALGRLCRQAQRNHAVVVTADPFLGLLSQWPSQSLHQLISIDIPENATPAVIAAKRAADAMLHTELSGAEKLLRAVPHLYPSHTNMDGLMTASTDSRNLSFFNDALLLPPTIAVIRPNIGGNLSATKDRPHWMFLISQADYQTQAMFLGSMEFAKVVANLLTQTAQLGRHAIFLGPSQFIDLVKLVLPADDHIHLLPFCSFRHAMSLLLTAEYSYYWNIVSHSILLQLWNGRPVILFDRGHLVRAMPAIYERVIAWYYQGWEPPYLDPNEHLSFAALEEAVAPHAQLRMELMARFRRAPSPATVFNSLLDRCRAAPLINSNR